MKWSRRGFSGGVGLLILLLLAGCRNEPITWRAPLHQVIFLNDTLTWNQLVPDTLWTDGDEGLILHASARQSLFETNDWIPSLDTSWSTTFELPFIGGPIPVAPGAEIWGEEETIAFDLPDVGLRRARLGGGVLEITATSTVQGPLELVYRIEGADFPSGAQGGGGEFIVSIAPGEPASLLVPLEGVELDLDGTNNLDVNRLVTSWNVRVPATAATEVGIFGSDVLTLSVALDGIVVAQVEGSFAQRSLEVSDTVIVGELGAIQSLEVQWTDIGIDLTLSNTAGLDLIVGLDALQRMDSLSGGETTALMDPALQTSMWLPRATVVETDGMESWEIEPGEATLSLGTEGDFLEGFLSTVPEAFVLSGDAEINPMGDVSGGYDRLDLHRLPEVEWTVKAPLNFGLSEVVWVDTLAPILPDGLAFDGTLNLSFESSLPVGARLEMSLIELPQVFVLLHQGAAENWNALGPIELDPGSGSAEVPTITEAEWNMEPWHFDALRQGARLRVQLTCATPEAGAQFEVDQRVVIQGHLEGDAVISIE